jgi:hypothetical protein
MPSGPVTPSANFTVSFDYSWNLSGCPDCDILMGMELSTEALSGNIHGTSVACWTGEFLESDNPVSSGTGSVTFTAPATKGIYYIFLDSAREEYTCGQNGTNAAPKASSYVGAILVN